MDDAFIQIDREGAVKSLHLKERGVEQGELDLPSATSSTEDVVENEIISAMSEHLNTAQISAANNVLAFEQRLSELHLLYEAGAIRSATKKALGDFKTLLVDWSNRLANRRDSVRESYHELRDFKRVNGLERPVHDAQSTVGSTASIAVAWLIEAAGNTFFLKVNDEMGWLGGVVAAAFVAAVNISIAVAAGMILWPRTNLRPGRDRTVAWIGVIAWFCVVIVWNLTAAHFRDAKSAGEPEPDRAARQLLLTDPYALQGLYSWALLLVGLLAALFAARAGYQRDDPYPGYGDRGRRHQQRCEDYAEEVAQANRELTEVRNEAIDDAQDVKHELGKQFRDRARIEKAYGHFAQRFKEHQSRLEEVTNYLLSVYRDANRKARKASEPAHFSQRYELQKSAISPLTEQRVREADIKAADDALNESINQIAQAFDDSIGNFTPLEQLKAELERGAL